MRVIAPAFLTTILVGVCQAREPRWTTSPPRLAIFGLNRMVLNRTGLTGGYDLELQWIPDNARAPAGDTANQAPSIFTALQEQLGLSSIPSAVLSNSS
jgi:hypothetical protein